MSTNNFQSGGGTNVSSNVQGNLLGPNATGLQTFQQYQEDLEKEKTPVPEEKKFGSDYLSNLYNRVDFGDLPVKNETDFVSSLLYKDGFAQSMFEMLKPENSFEDFMDKVVGEVYSDKNIYIDPTIPDESRDALAKAYMNPHAKFSTLSDSFLFGTDEWIKDAINSTSSGIHTNPDDPNEYVIIKDGKYRRYIDGREDSLAANLVNTAFKTVSKAVTSTFDAATEILEDTLGSGTFGADDFGDDAQNLLNRYNGSYLSYKDREITPEEFQNMSFIDQQLHGLSQMTDPETILNWDFIKSDEGIQTLSSSLELLAPGMALAKGMKAAGVVGLASKAGSFVDDAVKAAVNNGKRFSYGSQLGAGLAQVVGYTLPVTILESRMEGLGTYEKKLDLYSQETLPDGTANPDYIADETERKVAANEAAVEHFKLGIPNLLLSNAVEAATMMLPFNKLKQFGAIGGAAGIATGFALNAPMEGIEEITQWGIQNYIDEKYSVAGKEKGLQDDSMGDSLWDSYSRSLEGFSNDPEANTAFWTGIVMGGLQSGGANLAAKGKEQYYNFKYKDELALINSSVNGGFGIYDTDEQGNKTINYEKLSGAAKQYADLTSNLHLTSNIDFSNEKTSSDKLSIMLGERYSSLVQNVLQNDTDGILRDLPKEDFVNFMTNELNKGFRLSPEEYEKKNFQGIRYYDWNKITDNTLKNVLDDVYNLYYNQEAVKEAKDTGFEKADVLRIINESTGNKELDKVIASKSAGLAIGKSLTRNILGNYLSEETELPDDADPQDYIKGKNGYYRVTDPKNRAHVKELLDVYKKYDELYADLVAISGTNLTEENKKKQADLLNRFESVKKYYQDKKNLSKNTLGERIKKVTDSAVNKFKNRKKLSVNPLEGIFGKKKSDELVEEEAAKSAEVTEKVEAEKQAEIIQEAVTKAEVATPEQQVLEEQALQGETVDETDGFPEPFDLAAEAGLETDIPTIEEAMKGTPVATSAPTEELTYDPTNVDSIFSYAIKAKPQGMSTTDFIATLPEEVQDTFNKGIAEKAGNAEAQQEQDFEQDTDNFDVVEPTDTVPGEVNVSSEPVIPGETNGEPTADDLLNSVPAKITEQSITFPINGVEQQFIQTGINTYRITPNSSSQENLLAEQSADDIGNAIAYTFLDNHFEKDNNEVFLPLITSKVKRGTNISFLPNQNDSAFRGNQGSYAEYEQYRKNLNILFAGNDEITLEIMDPNIPNDVSLAGYVTLKKEDFNPIQVIIESASDATTMVHEPLWFLKRLENGYYDKNGNYTPTKAISRAINNHLSFRDSLQQEFLAATVAGNNEIVQGVITDKDFSNFDFVDRLDKATGEIVDGRILRNVETSLNKSTDSSERRVDSTFLYDEPNRDKTNTLNTKNRDLIPVIHGSEISDGVTNLTIKDSSGKPKTISVKIDKSLLSDKTDNTVVTVLDDGNGGYKAYPVNTGAVSNQVKKTLANLINAFINPTDINGIVAEINKNLPTDQRFLESENGKNIANREKLKQYISKFTPVVDSIGTVKSNSGSVTRIGLSLNTKNGTVFLGNENTHTKTSNKGLITREILNPKGTTGSDPVTNIVNLINSFDKPGTKKGILPFTAAKPSSQSYSSEIPIVDGNLVKMVKYENLVREHYYSGIEIINTGTNNSQEIGFVAQRNFILNTKVGSLPAQQTATGISETKAPEIIPTTKSGLGENVHSTIFEKSVVETTKAETTPITSNQSEIETKKADIEKLEKEKQETLKPLIEEKEQIEKEIEEIENSSKSDTDHKKGIDRLLSQDISEKAKKIIKAFARDVTIPFSYIVEQVEETTGEIITLDDTHNKLDSLQENIETQSKKDSEKRYNDLLEQSNIELEKENSVNDVDKILTILGVSGQTKFIWDLIKNVAEKLGVKIIFSDKQDVFSSIQAKGVFYLNENKIYVNVALLKNGAENFNKTTVHELVHGVTRYIVKIVNKSIETKVAAPGFENITKEQKQAVKNLNALLEELQKDENFKDEYGITNVDELLAELANEAFVVKLKNKKFNGNESFFDKIVSLITELLGFNVSAYDIVYESLETLISTPNIEALNSIKTSELKSDFSKNTTQLQQLKQRLVEVNKKIDEVTKRFDSQIAQKQAELKALEAIPSTGTPIIENNVRIPKTEIDGLEIDENYDFQDITNKLEDEKAIPVSDLTFLDDLQSTIMGEIAEELLTATLSSTQSQTEIAIVDKITLDKIKRLSELMKAGLTDKKAVLFEDTKPILTSDLYTLLQKANESGVRYFKLFKDRIKLATQELLDIDQQKEAKLLDLDSELNEAQNRDQMDDDANRLFNPTKKVSKKEKLLYNSLIKEADPTGTGLFTTYYNYKEIKPRIISLLSIGNDNYYEPNTKEALDILRNKDFGWIQPLMDKLTNVSKYDPELMEVMKQQVLVFNRNLEANYMQIYVDYKTENAGTAQEYKTTQFRVGPITADFNRREVVMDIIDTIGNLNGVVPDVISNKEKKTTSEILDSIGFDLTGVNVTELNNVLKNTRYLKDEIKNIALGENVSTSNIKKVADFISTTRKTPQLSQLDNAKTVSLFVTPSQMGEDLAKFINSNRDTKLQSFSHTSAKDTLAFFKPGNDIQFGTAALAFRSGEDTKLSEFNKMEYAQAVFNMFFSEENDKSWYISATPSDGGTNYLIKFSNIKIKNFRTERISDSENAYYYDNLIKPDLDRMSAPFIHDGSKVYSLANHNPMKFYGFEKLYTDGVIQFSDNTTAEENYARFLKEINAAKTDKEKVEIATRANEYFRREIEAYSRKEDNKLRLVNLAKESMQELSDNIRKDLSDTGLLLSMEEFAIMQRSEPNKAKQYSHGIHRSLIDKVSLEEFSDKMLGYTGDFQVKRSSSELKNNKAFSAFVQEAMLSTIVGNYAAFHNNMQYIFQGDPSLYAKGYNVNDQQGSYDNFLGNLFKRLKSNISPRDIGNDKVKAVSKKGLKAMKDGKFNSSNPEHTYERTHVNHIIAKDIKIPGLNLSGILDVMGSDLSYGRFGFNPEIITKETYETFSTKEKLDVILANVDKPARFFPEAKDHFNVAIADAQEYWHYTYGLDFLEEQGEITSQKKLDIIQRVESDTLTKDDYKYLGVQKPLHVGTRNISDNNGNTTEGNNWQIRDYIKSSAKFLYPQLVKDTEWEDIYNNMEKNNVDAITFDSAVKVGGPSNPVNLFSDKGEYTGVDLTDITVLSSKFKGKQLNIPLKEENKIADPAQPDAKFGPGLENLTMEDGTSMKSLLSDLESAKRDKREIEKEKIRKRLSNSDGTLNIKKLHAYLQEELNNRGFENNAKDVVTLMQEIDPDGEIVDILMYPLHAMTQPKRFDALIASLVTKAGISKGKTPGFGLPQVASVGFKSRTAKKKELSEIGNRSIVTVGGWDLSKGLSHYTMGTEHNPRGLAEIIVPWLFPSPIENFTEDGTKYGKIDLTKLPEELLEGLGFRIPYQNYSSSMGFKIVGFTTDPNSVFVPHEIASQMGSDYDIDKLYGMLPDIEAVYDINGRFNNKAQVESRLNKVQESINEILEDMLTIGEKTGKLETLKDQIDNSEVSTDTIDDVIDQIKNSPGKKLILLTEQLEQLQEVLAKEAPDAFRKSNSRAGKVNNKIHDIRMRIISHPEVKKKGLQALDTGINEWFDWFNNTLRDSVESTNSTKSYLDFNYQGSKSDNARVGKKGIGAFSLNGSTISKFSGKNVTLGKYLPIAIEYRDENNNVVRAINDDNLSHKYDILSNQKLREIFDKGFEGKQLVSYLDENGENQYALLDLYEDAKIMKSYMDNIFTDLVDPANTGIDVVLADNDVVTEMVETMKKENTQAQFSLMGDDYFEGNFKYQNEENNVSNFITNKLKYKTREFYGKYDPSITSLSQYKNKVLNDLLKEIGIPYNINDITELKDKLSSPNFETDLLETLNTVVNKKNNFSTNLSDYHSTKRLLNNFFKHFDINRYDSDQQFIITKYLPSLFKDNKFKSDKQAIAFNRRKINSFDWGNKEFKLDIITKGFLGNFAKEKKIETLINYFKIDRDDATERILSIVNNELNRRERFFTSEKTQLKINAKIAEDNLKKDAEQRERDERKLRELNKFKNSTVVSDVEGIDGSRNIQKLDNLLESEYINEELAVIKNNGYSLDKTPDGKESKLFQNILELPEVDGNAEIAYKIKSLVYSDNFLNWFGDWLNNTEESSKIIDENGEPKLVYHGSGREYDTFNEKERGSTTGKWNNRLSDSEMSFMFTDNPSVAFYYSIIERQNVLREISYYIDQVSVRPTQEIIDKLYQKYPSVKEWVTKLKNQGLDRSQIIDEFSRVAREYGNLSELTVGGSIGNQNSNLNSRKKVISYLEKNKNEILKKGISKKDIGKWTTATLPNIDKYNTIFFETSKEYRTTYILSDGRLSGFEDISLNNKNISDLTSDEFDKVVLQFQEDFVYAYEKISDQLKAGGFTPKIYPVFLNAKSVNSKDFNGRPFMFQHEDTEELVAKKESTGAAFEVADLIEEAVNTKLDGSIIKNIADPNVSTNYAVFRPNQIKSVFNNGLYSSESDSILFSKDVPGENVKPTVDLSREWKGDLESRPVYTDEGVNTMRTTAAQPSEHFGNPFSEAGYGNTVKARSVAEAVQMYKDWLLNDYATTKDYNLDPKEFVKAIIKSAGGKPTSKGMFAIDGQYYYIPGIDIMEKPYGYDAFIVIGNDELYLGSSNKGYTDFVSRDEYNLSDLNYEQQQWILNQINQGKLDGANLLYAGKLAGRGEGMHPTALAEVVEELRGAQIQNEEYEEYEEVTDSVYEKDGREIKTHFELSSDQKKALDELIDFTKDPKQKMWMLQGAAGTGKTSIIGYLQNYLGEDFLYLAPTHAATVQLAFSTWKTGNRSLPITVRSSMKIEKLTGQVALSGKAKEKIGLGRIIVVDETSMLAKSDYNNLKELVKRGYKLIFMGDKKQIPEVTTTNANTKNVSDAFVELPTSNLDKIHRTSNNKLKSVLQNTRDSTEYQLFQPSENTQSLTFYNEEVSFNQDLRDTVLSDPENTMYIGYTNNVVKGKNAAIRKLLGRSGVVKENDIVTGYLGYASKQIEKGNLANSVNFTIKGITEINPGQFKLNLESKKLSRLKSDGFDEIPSNFSTRYLPLSDKDSLETTATDDQYLTNNQEISKVFQDFHAVYLAYLKNPKMYGDYLDAQQDVSAYFMKVDLGYDYIYDPSLNSMLPYDKYNKSDKTLQEVAKRNNLLGQNGQFNTHFDKLKVEKGIDYGHAITIHKSQGSTIDNVFFDASTIPSNNDTNILEDGKQISTERQSLAYVGLSRSSKKLSVYTGTAPFETVDTSAISEFDPIPEPKLRKKQTKPNQTAKKDSTGVAGFYDGERIVLNKDHKDFGIGKAIHEHMHPLLNDLDSIIAGTFDGQDTTKDEKDTAIAVKQKLFMDASEILGEDVVMNVLTSEEYSNISPEQKQNEIIARAVEKVSVDKTKNTKSFMQSMKDFIKFLLKNVKSRFYKAVIQDRSFTAKDLEPIVGISELADVYLVTGAAKRTMDKSGKLREATATDKTFDSVMEQIRNKGKVLNVSDNSSFQEFSTNYNHSKGYNQVIEHEEPKLVDKSYNNTVYENITVDGANKVAELEASGLNPDTLNIATSMTISGFDPKHVTIALNNPMLKEYFTRLKAKEITEGWSISNQADTLTEMKLKYLPNSAINTDLSPSNFYTSKKDPNGNTILEPNFVISEDMMFDKKAAMFNKDRQDVSEQNSEVLEHQFRSLLVTLSFGETNKDLIGLANLFNLNSSGGTRSFNNDSEIYDNIKALLETNKFGNYDLGSVLDENFTKQVFENFIEIRDLFTSEKGISAVIDHKSFVDDIIEVYGVHYTVGEYTPSKRRKFRDKLVNIIPEYVKAQVFSKIPTKDNLESTKFRLLSNDSTVNLAGRIASIKEKMLTDKSYPLNIEKVFFEATEVKREAKYSLVKFNGGRISPDVKNNITTNLTALYNVPVDLGFSDGYTSKDLIDDLFDYSIVTGANTGPGKFFDYLPSKILLRDFAKFERDFEFPVSNRNNILISFLMNNPDLLPGLETLPKDYTGRIFKTKTGDIFLVNRNPETKEASVGKKLDSIIDKTFVKQYTLKTSLKEDVLTVSGYNVLTGSDAPQIYQKDTNTEDQISTKSLADLELLAKDSSQSRLVSKHAIGENIGNKELKAAYQDLMLDADVQSVGIVITDMIDSNPNNYARYNKDAHIITVSRKALESGKYSLSGILIHEYTHVVMSDMVRMYENIKNGSLSKDVLSPEAYDKMRYLESVFETYREEFPKDLASMNLDEFISEVRRSSEVRNNITKLPDSKKKNILTRILNSITDLIKEIFGLSPENNTISGQQILDATLDFITTLGKNKTTVRTNGTDTYTFTTSRDNSDNIIRLIHGTKNGETLVNLDEAYNAVVKDPTYSKYFLSDTGANVIYKDGIERKTTSSYNLSVPEFNAVMKTTKTLMKEHEYEHDALMDIISKRFYNLVKTAEINKTILRTSKNPEELAKALDTVNIIEEELKRIQEHIVKATKAENTKEKMDYVDSVIDAVQDVVNSDNPSVIEVLTANHFLTKLTEVFDHTKTDISVYSPDGVNDLTFINEEAKNDPEINLKYHEQVSKIVELNSKLLGKTFQTIDKLMKQKDEFINTDFESKYLKEEIGAFNKWLMTPDRSGDPLMNSWSYLNNDVDSHFKLEYATKIEQIKVAKEKAVPALQLYYARLTDRDLLSHHDKYGTYSLFLDENGNFKTRYKKEFFDITNKAQTKRDNAQKEYTADPTPENLKVLKKAKKNHAEARSKSSYSLKSDIEADLAKETDPNKIKEFTRVLEKFDKMRADKLDKFEVDLAVYINSLEKHPDKAELTLEFIEEYYPAISHSDLKEYVKSKTKQVFEYKIEKGSVMRNDSATLTPIKEVNKSYEYHHSVPKPEYWNDMDFLDNPDIKGFYDLYTEMMKEIIAILPKNKGEALNLSQIPFIARELLDYSLKDMVTNPGTRKTVITDYVQKLVLRENYISKNDTGQSYDNEAINTRFGKTNAFSKETAIKERLIKRLTEEGLPIYDSLGKLNPHKANKVKGAYTKEFTKIYKEIKDQVELELADMKSFDLGLVIEMYYMEAMMYKHKMNQLNEMNLIKDTSMKVWGGVKDSNGQPVPLQDKMQMLTNADKIFKGIPARIARTNGLLNFTGKKYSNLEKRRKEDLEISIEILKKDLEDVSLLEENEENLMKRESIMQEIQRREDEINSLGGYLHAGNMLRQLMQVHTFIRLGFNPSSSTGNVIQGIIGNRMEAADGRIFTKQSHDKIFDKIYKKSSLSPFLAGTFAFLATAPFSLGLGAVVGYGVNRLLHKTRTPDPDTVTILNMMGMYDLVQEQGRELQLKTESTRKSRTWSSKLMRTNAAEILRSPMLFINKSEIPHQAVVLGAILDSVKISLSEDTEQSLLDLLTSLGTDGMKFNTDYNQIVNLKLNTTFGSTITQVPLGVLLHRVATTAAATAAKTHGNYRTNVKQLAKLDDYTVLGTEFKTWAFEGFYNRYEEDKPNITISKSLTSTENQLADQDYITKGMYQTAKDQLGIPLTFGLNMFTPNINALLMGFIGTASGAGIFSALPAVLQAGTALWGLKHLHAKRYEKDVNPNVQKAFVLALAQRAARSATMGKAYKKFADIEIDGVKVNPQEYLNEVLSVEDAANLRKLIEQSGVLVSVSLLYYLAIGAKLAVGSDDEDDVVARRYTNFVMNTMGRTMLDIESYTSPGDIWDKYGAIEKIAPTTKFMFNIADVIDSAVNWEKYEASKKGQYEKGDLKFIKQLERITPAVNQVGAFTTKLDQELEMFNANK